MVSGGCQEALAEETMGELLLNRYRISVLQDEGSSGDGGGDGRTITRMYVISLNCTLKN